jgi:HD-GYP domain-containing protein (c-di-GMP phosphodiesterase class II)
MGILFFGGLDGGPRLELWVHHFLEAVVASTSVALRNLEMLEDYRNLSLVGVKGLVAALETHRPPERGHAGRVVRNSVIVGRAIGLDENSLRELAVSAYLHDIGKLGSKPEEDPPEAPPGAAPVDRRHPLVGSKILSHARPMPPVIQGVEQHHERWDGQGFPYGLVGSGIHLYGRIIAIADAHDRWIHAVDGSLAPEEALRRLEVGAGLLWDPGLVAVFCSELGRSPNRAHPTVSDPWIEGIAAPV